MGVQLALVLTHTQVFSMQFCLFTEWDYVTCPSGVCFSRGLRGVKPVCVLRWVRHKKCVKNLDVSTGNSGANGRGEPHGAKVSLWVRSFDEFRFFPHFLGELFSGVFVQRGPQKKTGKNSEFGQSPMRDSRKKKDSLGFVAVVLPLAQSS